MLKFLLDFADQTSFSDKLTQLGQYAIDNATDDIKDFLYSVYSYCNDNGITSIWGLMKFVGLQAAKFFGAITNWIGGSLLLNRSSVGQGLLDSLVDNPFDFYNSYSYVNSFVSVFNQYSGYNYSDVTGFFMGYYYQFITGFNNLSSSDIFVFSPLGVGIYNLVDGSLVRSTASFSQRLFEYNQYSGWNVAPNLYSYSPSRLYNTTSIISFSFTSSFGVDISHFVSYFLSLNHAVYIADSLSNTIVSGHYRPYIEQDVLNPAVDNVYVPTDVWNIDIVGTWEQIARDISATYDQTERIAAFVGDIPLTLTSAQSYAPTINDAGNYVFPDFGSVWKYPQYFFDTLSGWGMFCR